MDNAGFWSRVPRLNQDLDYTRLAATFSDAELHFLTRLNGWNSIAEAARELPANRRAEIPSIVARLFAQRVILFDDPAAAAEIEALASHRAAPRPAPVKKGDAPPARPEAEGRDALEPGAGAPAPDGPSAAAFAPVFAEVWDKIPKLNEAVDFSRVGLDFSPPELQFLSRLTGWSSVRGASLGAELNAREIERLVARLAARRVVLFDDPSLAPRLAAALAAEEQASPPEPLPAPAAPLGEEERAPPAGPAPGDGATANEAPEAAADFAAAAAARPAPPAARAGSAAESGRWDLDTLFDVINRLHLAQRTGVLRLFRDPQTYKAAYFAQGRLANVLSVPFHVEECLGRLMQRAGQVNQEKVAESIRRAKANGTLQGEELMKMGAVRRDLLQDMLRVQVEVKLTEIMQWTGGIWTFRPLPALPPQAPPIDVRLARVLFNLIWKRYPADRVEREVQRRMELYVGRADATTYNAVDFEFGDSLDKFWRIVMEKDNTLKRLLIVSNLKPEHTTRMVWTLYLTGMIGFFEDTREDKMATRLMHWKNQLKIFERETLFDVLHVHWTADDRMIEHSYRQRLAELERDAAKASELELSMIDQLRGYMKQAYEALNTRNGRREYRAKIFDDEFILFGAEILRMKGESYLFTKDAPDLAAVELETALEVYDRNGEYYCELALADFLRFYPRDPKRVQQARDMMARGLKMTRDSEVSYLALGMLHRHEGRQKNAMEALQRVLEINPQNRFARIVINEIKSGKQSEERDDAIREFLERKNKADEDFERKMEEKKSQEA